jgi:hypothetical protein
MGGAIRFRMKVAPLNPPPVAFDSYEVSGTHIRNVATADRATIAGILYDDFIAANGFERGGTVIVEFAFDDQRGYLPEVCMRKLIGIRSYDLNLSGASRGDKQHGENHKARHRPNENKMSDGGRDRASLGVGVWKSSQM